MKFALLILLLAPAARAASKPRRKKAHARPAVAASTEAAAGYPLPLLPPTTEPITVDLVIQRFTDFDAHLKSLSCDFAQVVHWQESGVAQIVDGSLQYRKPDLLHIEQRSPEPQTMVSDGKWLWIWRRSTNQVIQTKFEDWKRSEPLAQSLMNFGDYAGMLKDFHVEISSVGAPDDKGYRTFELTLRPKEAAKSQDFALKLRLSTKDFFPAETELTAGQVVVRSTFKNVQYNPPIPDERFHFTPPADADVFQNFKLPKPE